MMGKSKEGKGEIWKVSTISRKYPTYRSIFPITVRSWIKGKQSDDEAEKLWRIHNTLYDFTDFVNHHPGGSFWLQQTKGTDITELFESHHISAIPEKMLSKYAVREAANLRNYTLTLYENGFYKTLKLRVREKLKYLDYSPRKRTDLMHLGLLLATLTFSMASARTDLIIFPIFAALSLCWLVIAAHNYFHQKDNWKMYTFNLSLLNYCDWRISHVLSHHVYTNSLHDLEMSFFEPVLCWIPNIHYSSKLQRIASLFIQPFAYILTFPGSFIIRLLQSIKSANVMYWHDGIGFMLPALMFITSGSPILYILRQWICIIGLSSFIFSFIGLNAAHHHPDVLHDGDTLRRDRDWGLFQLDAVMDREDIEGSQFLVLTHFGEHTLHHLFPTLDHGLLPQLKPILHETAKDFQAEMRECGHLKLVLGQNKQLLRTEPNLIPPGTMHK